MKITKHLGAMIVTLFSGHQALAAEGATYGGPIGGTDIRNAYVSPIPGFYGGLADVPGNFTQLNGNGGGKIRNASFDLFTNTNVLAVAYVYPFELFGGRIQTDAQFGYLDVGRFSIFNQTRQITGWTDSYWEFLKWAKYLGTAAAPAPGRRPLPYGLTVAAAYSMTLPIGHFEQSQPLRPGGNVFFFEPNVVATYLTQPNVLGDGVELDGRVFYNHALENPADHYRSGDILDLDYAVTERDGRWQWGATGYVASQLNHDLQNGRVVQPDGKYFVASKLGPNLAYDIPKLGISIKAKVTFGLFVQNTVFGPSGVVAVGFKIP